MKLLVKDCNEDCRMALKELNFDTIKISTWKEVEYISFVNAEQKEIYSIGKYEPGVCTLQDCGYDIEKIFTVIISNFINTDKILNLIEFESLREFEVYED